MKKGLFIITTAVPGKDAQSNAIKTMKHFAKKTGAQPICLRTLPVYVKDKDTYDAEIPKDWFIENDLNVNSSLCISTIQQRPEVSDPANGFARVTRTDSSLVLASPKQRFKLFPNKGNLPRAILSTGAITYADYKKNRAGVLAEKDHKMGALIVQVKNNKIFFHRMVRFAEDGSFIDKGIQYFSNGTTKNVKAWAMTPGDFHAVFIDKPFLKCLGAMAKLFKPSFLFLHDLFDAHSINHHHEGHEIYKAKKNRSLLSEGNITSDLLEDVSSWVSQTVKVVKSNHDEALDRYLEEGRYAKDYDNFEIGHQLAITKFNGLDPLENLLRRFNKLKKVIFLKRTDSVKHHGIENADHGDTGANGAKGSPKSQEIIHDKVTAGHTHSPEIFNDYYNPGVSGILDMDYVIGKAGTWLHGCVITYENGDRQLFVSINGEWE